ncbi:ABC transporter substrate-binding protein [Rhodococcus artemisiae]|uniref:ABC transporter substrate-binding protein n=1 Tax=Rhodococcus artemisiae TaxID=714159 RepID=A0ABU7LD86_9NOCA|nr:ABC transporter substrate-binding protein [Rhodococcus artemisiae]MEE2059507.1 ABC transporter substrate-binding protein [Rhodococcus artemisiae]
MFSRPAHLRRRSMLGAIALSFAGVLAVAGCTSAVDQAATEAGSAEVTEGGVLRIGDAGDLTPASLYSGAMAQATLTGLVYDTLISYPPEGLEPEPALAQSWEISPDGRSVTLTLRPDVTFHDGRPFTSTDVEFSLRTYADPMRAGQLASTAGLITEYDTSDPHALTLTLSQPASNILDLLDIVPIIDENSMAGFDAGSGYIGTGAFRFVEWKPGTSMTFEANEDYWDGAPHLDGVEYLVIPDAQTRVSQLRSGQLDLLLAIAPRDAEQLESDTRYQLVDQVGVERNWYIGANVQAPGINDVRVRQAIAYAVDNDRILADVYQGYGTVGSLPWPDYSPAYDADLNDTYAQDVDKAKALVAEVGAIPVIPITYTTGSSESEAVAQIIQADLAAAGIETGLEPVDQATNLKHLIGGTYGGLWITAHTYTQYTPATLPTSAYPFNAQKNTSNFIDPDYQAAVANAWQIVDPTSAEAEAAYKVLNTELLDNAFLIELFASENWLAMSGNVHGVDWSKKAELDLSDTYLSE